MGGGRKSLKAQDGIQTAIMEAREVVTTLSAAAASTIAATGVTSRAGHGMGQAASGLVEQEALISSRPADQSSELGQITDHEPTEPVTADRITRDEL